jgi:sulfatase modifying factor 1
MNYYKLAVFLFFTTLVLFQGCKRKTPDNVPKNAAEATGDIKDESGIEMVKLPHGRFKMGDENEIDAKPHEVFISSFYIDKYPVTQQQYKKIMGENPSRWKADKNPVEQVRWSDAVRFCNARSLREGLQPCYDLQTWQCNFNANGYRLPTEAQWEYACRAGTTTMYFFGNDSSKLTDYAWLDENSGGKPRPVGQKLPNPWGLYDMYGNVWQWCNDFYKVDYYQQSPEENPKGPKTGETKVVRGGAWKFSADSCRSGYRYNEDPGYSDVCFGYDIYGFRCVRNAPAAIEPE